MVDSGTIQKIVLDLLSRKYLRLTPPDLERAVRYEIPDIGRRDLRMSIREMVSRGTVTYTQHNSTTHLEINYRQPVRISDRIVITPPANESYSGREKVVISLQDGASFGGGDHPTTRMLLRGLDYITSREHCHTYPMMGRALDIGTGTGVLSIAAVKLGIGHVDGIDIDPAACHEAEKNASFNQVEDALHISTKGLDQFPENHFDLVLANLRPPTIKIMIPSILNLSVSKAIWLISGCRIDERARLIQYLPKAFSKIIWEEDMVGWAAFAVVGEKENGAV